MALSLGSCLVPLLMVHTVRRPQPVFYCEAPPQWVARALGPLQEQQFGSWLWLLLLALWLGFGALCTWTTTQMAAGHYI